MESEQYYYIIPEIYDDHQSFIDKKAEPEEIVKRIIDFVWYEHEELSEIYSHEDKIFLELFNDLKVSLGKFEIMVNYPDPVFCVRKRENRL